MSDHPVQAIWEHYLDLSNSLDSNPDLTPEAIEAIKAEMDTIRTDWNGGGGLRCEGCHKILELHPSGYFDDCDTCPGKYVITSVSDGLANLALPNPNL